jgi:hypothetical protein
MTALKISGQTLLFMVSVFNIRTNSMIRQLLSMNILFSFCGHVEELVNGQIGGKKDNREQVSGIWKGKEKAKGIPQ